MATVSSCTRPQTLAADVGGTNARIALVSEGSSDNILFQAHWLKTYRCADYPSLGAILDDYLQNLGSQRKIRAAAIAIAGQLSGGVVRGSRLAWDVHESELKEVIGEAPLHFVNDFYAAALGSQYAADIKSISLNRGRKKSGAVVVLGPGTGFGAAVIIKRNGQIHVLRTEAGQMIFATTTDAERSLIQDALNLNVTPRIETFLSGSGLELIYRLLRQIDGQTAEIKRAAEISRDAIGETNRYAERAVDLFWEMLASVVRSLSLAYYAEGGVLLTGGVVAHLMPTFQRQRFLDRLTDDEVMHDFLKNLPINVLDSAEVPVIGAAASIANRPSSDQSAMAAG